MKTALLRAPMLSVSFQHAGFTSRFVKKGMVCRLVRRSWFLREEFEAGGIDLPDGAFDEVLAGR